MWDWISALARLRQESQPAVIATVSRTGGSSPSGIGAKMIVLADGSILGTVGGGQIEQMAIRDALECLRSGESRAFTYALSPATGQCCGGVVELLMEVINAGPRLYLYGAGHVGQALCNAMAGTCFTVHVIDAREKWIRDSRLPETCIRHQCRWPEFNALAAWDAHNAYAVIMTPEHSEDFEILHALIPKPLRYLGVIGSHSKWRNFQVRLESLGVAPEAIGRVHCPVGIGNTGKSPAEIAISIAAELLLEHYGHSEHTAPAVGGRQVEPAGLSEGAANGGTSNLAGDSVSKLS